MKPLHYLPLLAALCGIATYAGMALAQPGQWSFTTAAPHRPSAPSAVAVKNVTARQILDGPGPSLRERQVAKESTETLWKKLDESPYYHGENQEIAAELLERLGVSAAMRHTLEIEDPGMREEMSEKILTTYAYKDVWAAYEIYKKERGAFHAGWCAASIPPVVMRQACLISADKLIECMDECPGPGSPDGFEAEFAPGFDFRKVLDYFDAEGPAPLSGPANLISGWARTDPVAAVSWEPKDKPDSSRSPSLDKKVGWPSEDLMTAIIEGRAPADQKKQALLLLPEWDRGQAWEAIAEDEWRLSAPASISPKLLEVVDAFKSRDDYLTVSLLATRGAPELDSSWAAVPLPEREPAIQRALAQWAAEEPTPLGNEARQQWEAWLRKSWAKP